MIDWKSSAFGICSPAADSFWKCDYTMQIFGFVKFGSRHQKRTDPANKAKNAIKSKARTLPLYHWFGIILPASSLFNTVLVICRRSSTAEQPPCKRSVMGSTPIVGSGCGLASEIGLYSCQKTISLASWQQLKCGRLPKWPTGTDCKSVGGTPSEVRILHRPLVARPKL